jgi:hypothetical protein
VAFDLLLADGEDLRPCCLRSARPGWRRSESAPCWAVVAADLEGIVAKRLADASRPKLARWRKILNRGYWQRRERGQWCRERGRHAGRRRR